MFPLVKDHFFPQIEKALNRGQQIEIEENEMNKHGKAIQGQKG